MSAQRHVVARTEAAKAAGIPPPPDDVQEVTALEKYRVEVRAGKGAPGGPDAGLGGFVPSHGGDPAPA